MVQELVENNIVSISGIVSSELDFSHTVYGEDFYNFTVDVMRLSKSYDKIPVTISERIVPIDQLAIGQGVEIEGQFRSYNQTDGDFKLMLSLFVKELRFIDMQGEGANTNSIELNGFICKKPTYRVTPFNREIADLLLAVNRPYNRSDYIPCILWGRNARYVKTLNVGDNLLLHGRIQSREYEKTHDNGEVEKRTAYEVSVSRVELLEEKE